MDKRNTLYYSARDQAYAWEILREIDAALYLTDNAIPFLQAREQIYRMTRSDTPLSAYDTKSARQWTYWTLRAHGYGAPKRQVSFGELQAEVDCVVQARCSLVSHVMLREIEGIVRGIDGMATPQLVEHVRTMIAALLTDTEILFE